MTARQWLSLILLQVFITTLACPIEADEPSYCPMDGDLLKGDSANVYSYHSQFFSFDLTIPADWHPLSSKEYLQLMRKKHPEEDYSEEGVKKRGTMWLMSVSRYTPSECGLGGEFNPNIIVGAVDLSKYPGIKTGKDFIEWTKSQMKALGVQPRSEPHTVQLGGIEFWRMDVVEGGDETRYTASVSTIRKGYALMFMLSAGSENDMSKLDEILKSLRFD